MSALRQPSLSRRRITALLRVLTVPLITVDVHSLTCFSPWLLVPLGIVAAALAAGNDFAVPGFRFLCRLNHVDRLAIWIVLVCLIVIGYLHNANSWTADERGFGKPADIAMWKTELILGIALAVPLLHTLARLVQPDAKGFPGQQFARELALYINFSGIALILWSGDAVLSRAGRHADGVGGSRRAYALRVGVTSFASIRRGLEGRVTTGSMATDISNLTLKSRRCGLRKDEGGLSNVQGHVS